MISIIVGLAIFVILTFIVFAIISYLIKEENELPF